MTDRLDDTQVRLATFKWLEQQVERSGDVFPRSVLQEGFVLDGHRVRLVGPQGIFKPRVLPEIPLSITTVSDGPYDDGFEPGGLLRYRYRGTDPMHHENVTLRKAMAGQIPLVYFHAIVPGKYLAEWPVYIVGDNPDALSFTVAIDIDLKRFEIADSQRPEDPSSRRAYITATFRRRLHQRGFRERVLRAYREHCAVCRIRHSSLLDAAHIVPDSEGGDPIVSNGLALCKIHHAAFDSCYIGIRPDYVVVVRRDMLDEKDGPMLLHGFQELHNTRIQIPKPVALRPDPQFLERRYESFRSA